MFAGTCIPKSRSFDSLPLRYTQGPVAQDDSSFWDGLWRHYTKKKQECKFKNTWKARKGPGLKAKTCDSLVQGPKVPFSPRTDDSSVSHLMLRGSATPVESQKNETRHTFL